jgi:hypothetical protein
MGARATAVDTSDDVKEKTCSLFHAPRSATRHNSSNMRFAASVEITCLGRH